MLFSALYVISKNKGGKKKPMSNKRWIKCSLVHIMEYYVVIKDDSIQTLTDMEKYIQSTIK